MTGVIVPIRGGFRTVSERDARNRHDHAETCYYYRVSPTVHIKTARLCRWRFLMSPEEIGVIVAKRRRELRLNQNELAELACVSERFVRDLEHGKLTVRLDKTFSVFAVLGLSVTVAVNTK